MMMNLVVTWMLLIAPNTDPYQSHSTHPTYQWMLPPSTRPLQLLTLRSCWLSATLSVIVSPWFHTEGGRGNGILTAPVVQPWRQLSSYSWPMVLWLWWL